MTEAYKGELNEEERKWKDLDNIDHFNCPECGSTNVKRIGNGCRCNNCECWDDAILFY